MELTGILCNAALSGPQGASAQRELGFRVVRVLGVLGVHIYTIISIKRNRGVYLYYKKHKKEP